MGTWWQDILDWITKYKDALGVLLGSGILVVIGTGIYKLTIWLGKARRARKTRMDTSPFKIILPNSNIAKEILGGADDDPLTDRNIPYQQRMQRHNTRREIEDLLEHYRWVLITGRTGLGKTREAIHLTQNLNNEGWTVLYLTREQWLDAPTHLPEGIPERKLLFLLDDLNRKMYAGHVEQSPKAGEPLQPITEPLQKRLYRTLETYEMLCGKSDILVVATARNETTSDFPDEPNEWGKLEFDRYPHLWKRFKLYELLEPDDQAQIHLLSEVSQAASIATIEHDFGTIAMRNDGTFANIIENLRTAKNNNQPLDILTFRDTLKGTWEKRYRTAVAKNKYAKYLYDAVDLSRSARLNLWLITILDIASIIARKNHCLFSFTRNLPILWKIARLENLSRPHDGQIEAKGYRIGLEEYLPSLRLYVYLKRFIGLSKSKKFFQIFSLCLEIMVLAILPESIIDMKNEPTKFHIFFYRVLPISLHNVAFAYHHSGFPNYAEKMYMRALELGPFPNVGNNRKSIARSWNNLGYVYLELQRLDDAIPAFLKAIELNPKYSFPWNGMGVVYFYQSKYDDAIFAYQKALELNPKYSSPWIGMGRVYLNQNKYDDAISSFQKAIELNPKYSSSWNDLGRVYFYQNKYNDAISAFQKAIELNPNYASPWNNMGFAYYDQSKFDDAIFAYQKAIELDSKYVYSWNGLADTFSRMGKTDDAIAAYQKANEVDPKYATPWHGLGTIYIYLDRMDEAIAAFKTALELNPKYASPWNGLGKVYRKLGKIDDATAAFKKAIKLDPKNGNSRGSLARILQNLGKEAEAAKENALAHRLMRKEDEYDRACLESICGHVEEALRLLKIGLEKKQTSLAWIRHDPDFDFIRDDPRFKELVGED
jgi:tetratricopeptide (TPR) repeat protein